MDTKLRRAKKMHGLAGGFTLVELLVVITIIGILAALITVAAVGALKAANQARIKIDADQISGGFEKYKNDYTAYPPNCQTDGTSGIDAPINESQVLSDLKRHLRQVAPKLKEPPELIAALAGLAGSGVSHQLAGGMTAGEAVAFWLGGFSSDPEYPISGDGGPSYAVVDQARSINIAPAERRKADPISNRRWVFPFEVTRLRPRADDEYFDETDGRYIEYRVNTGSGIQTRRINFWQYVPTNSEQPYLYFDTSRHPAMVLNSGTATGPFDPPAATALSGIGLHVHALKKRSDSSQSNTPQIQFVDPDKFQVLHCGNDDVWDNTNLDNFERMSVHHIGTNNPDDYVLFPTGPFLGEIADTVVNFATQTKIEDAAP
jgi:prepilin-type N-terminal cleavage/methylation domain-containing protein